MCLKILKGVNYYEHIKYHKLQAKKILLNCLGVSVKTLQRWDREGTLKGKPDSN